jgi:hypothetical protein
VDAAAGRRRGHDALVSSAAARMQLVAAAGMQLLAAVFFNEGELVQACNGKSCSRRMRDRPALVSLTNVEDLLPIGNRLDSSQRSNWQQ